MVIAFQRSKSEYADGIRARRLGRAVQDRLDATQGRLGESDDPCAALDRIELLFGEFDASVTALGKHLFSMKTLQEPPSCPGCLAGDAALCPSHRRDESCMHERPGAPELPVYVRGERGEAEASAPATPEAKAGGPLAMPQAAVAKQKTHQPQLQRVTGDVSFQAHTEARLKEWLSKRMSVQGVRALKVESWLEECPFGIAPGCLNFAEFADSVRRALLSLEKQKSCFLLKESARDFRTWSVRFCTEAS